MCECVIGLLSRGYEGCELVTLQQLKDRIAEKRYYNEVLIPTYATEPARLLQKVWQLKDYGDFRKSTDLTRFNHCPYCGKAINWKEIKRMEDVERSTDY
jgi:hypothetical protein